MPNLGVFDAWHFPMIQWSNMVQFCAESGRLHQCQVILLRLWRCGCSRKNQSDGPVVDGTGMYWLKLMFDISGLFSNLSVHKVSPPRTTKYLQREELIRTDAVPNWQLHIKQLKRKFKPFKSYESVTNHMPLLVVCIYIYIHMWYSIIFYILYIQSSYLQGCRTHPSSPETTVPPSDFSLVYKPNIQMVYSIDLCRYITVMG